MEHPSRSLPMLPLPGVRPERRDAAANRERILAAARRLIAEGGPERLSMDAVAAAAGVGKGTIFRRFGDRAGLTEALVDEYMRGFQDAFLSGPPPLGPGATPAERLEAFLVALVRLQRENLPVAIARAPTSDVRYAGGYSPLHMHLRMLLGRLHPELDASATATMLLGAVSPPVLDTVLRVQGASVETVVASVTALLRGLAPG